MGFKDTFFSENLSINCRGRLLDLASPMVMGILNITPDSFFDGGRYPSRKDIENKVKQMIHDGAGIIDIGGMSSRPGAKPITVKEEWERIAPALEIIRFIDSDIPVSVDTFRTEIAFKAVKEFKADIINDITGGNGDPEMFGFIGEEKIPYILMHMRGTPETMQDAPVYEDVVDEVLMFLQKKIAELREMGAIDIIVDPGFGFGKTIDHNYALLSNLEVFNVLEVPLLIGISRKSMIFNFLGIKPEEALNATTALHMTALMKGTRILRVHDVGEAVQTVKLYKKLSEDKGFES